jgi:hypothetical protein
MISKQSVDEVWVINFQRETTVTIFSNNIVDNCTELCQYHVAITEGGSCSKWMKYLVLFWSKTCLRIMILEVSVSIKLISQTHPLVFFQLNEDWSYYYLSMTKINIPEIGERMRLSIICLCWKFLPFTMSYLSSIRHTYVSFSFHFFTSSSFHI